jgi:hypothetical protein
MEVSMKNARKRLTWSGGHARPGIVLAALIIAASPLGAQATTQTSNQRLRFSNRSVVVPGRGTFVVNGGLHVLLHSTLDASGGCHVTGHANPQGLSVRGPTGTTYRAAGAANFTLQSTGANDNRFHGVLNLNLIGKGQAPDARLHMNVKTEPLALVSCDARRVAQMIIDELGITFPPAPGT